ncbi:MAG: nicotinate (nicotinamide) nucleotide adenylyltransferase [Sedimentisphaerales bacterium]|nr:nicotinate (nicotinamide) nucleotide adenylyltransferase [Sedimentisphaerales bacterium]
MTERRIALFGGTFDPIHRGHTEVAGTAARRIGAERLIFVPAKRSPLKGFSPVAGDDDRLKMIALAIDGTDWFAVSDRELRRATPSYTLDTVRQFQDELGPQTPLYWLVGADSVDDLVYWHKIEELIDTCRLAIMYRGGYPAPRFDKYVPLWGSRRVQKLRKNVVETPSIDLSSTQVRERLAAGEDVSDMLHPSVLAYIRARGLYRRV